ncbi:MAG: PQQ-binding-like beta-propeller repeat protein [Planctomycetia bacterium]|nr:PQQ-binding-like beta-propeller repeat protein [Planctomycetia bacterium]
MRNFRFGLCFLLAASTAHAQEPENWTEFLGPRRNGIARTTGLNTDWKAKRPAVLWSAPLGEGYGSMSLFGDRLFTMHKRGQRDFIVCLDAETGKEVWAFDAAASFLDKQKICAGPRSTPTYHAGKLYCLLARGEFYCLNADDGKVLWKTNIIEGTKSPERSDDWYYWGMSGSPLIEGDLVIVQPGGNQGNSVAAYHKDTGKLVWMAGNDSAGYGSPIVIQAHGQRVIVCATGEAVLGLDAKGTVLWRHPFGNGCNCATPLWANDSLFVSAAYGVGSVLLKLDFKDGKWTVREQWSTKQFQNEFGTSIALDGVLYGCHGERRAAQLRCIDLETGKEKWSDRKPGKCALLAYEGHLICISESGVVRLLEATPQAFKVKAELTDVLTDTAWPPPALHRGRLYLRDDKKLVCVDLRR